MTDIEKSESEMESSLPDENTLSAFMSDLAAQLTGASFSNECDNMYGVVFKTSDFKDIVSGAAFSLPGRVEFSSSDGTNSNTLIECRVY